MTLVQTPSTGAVERGASGVPLMEISGLKTYFYTDRGVARAVDGVSFSIPSG